MKLKRILKLISIAVTIPLFLFISSYLAGQSKVNAQADAGGFVIKNFDSNLIINSDNSADITETIDVTFSEYRHGIFRFIPLVAEVKGADGKIIDKRIELQIKSVTMNGTPEPYTASINHDINSKLSNSAFGLLYDNQVIKIGSENETVTNNNKYQIKYHVDNILTARGDTAYLDWGVTGTQWNVPIYSSSFTVDFAKDLASKNASLNTVKCFAGALGSTDSARCTVSNSVTNATGKITQTLNAAEGFNLEVTFPKILITKNAGSLDQTAPSDYLLLLLTNLIPFILAFSPLFVLFGTFIYWLIHRAPKGTGIIVPYYDPPQGLRAAEAGLIYDESVDNVDNSATIISLAINGYMKIQDDGKGNYTFTNLEKDTLDLRPFEKMFLDGFFKDGAKVVELNDLKNKFYLTLDKINNELQGWAVREGYFRSKSSKNAVFGQLTVFIIAFVLIFTLLGSVLSFNTGVFAIIFVLTASFSVLCILFFFGTLNHKTKRGVQIREKILGLKQYIELGEKSRINIVNSPEMTTELFEKLLPYAMVFKQHKAWAEKFKDIYVTPPDWYSGNWNTFNAIYLAASLNNISSSVNNTLSSSPSSSGSGFSGGGFGGSSGGGFGGGGGGSW